MGAWIEIWIELPNTLAWYSGVAPYMGAWIEIFAILGNQEWVKSHPTWVRGLKIWIELP